MTDKHETIEDPDGFMTIKNKPSLEELTKYYHEHYFSDDNLRPLNYQESYDEKEIEHINLTNDLCLFALTNVRTQWKETPGTMLEVGVGEGFTMSRAKLQGWKVHGVDFSSQGIENFNPQILNDVEIGNAFDILNDLIKRKNKFDVCMIRFMLEHVPEPRKLLENLRELLNDNGIIVITIPNDFSKTQMKAIEYKYINEKFWIAPPEHLNYFNINNFSTFMKKMNFKIIDMYSSLPIDFFIFHPGSNFIAEKKNGKPAHRARIELELMMAEEGLPNYHRLCQAFASCNVGRTITAFLESK